MRKKKKRKTLIVLFVTLAVMFVSLLGLYCYFRILYPMKYQDLISKYAEEYQLDPYSVSAVYLEGEPFSRRCGFQCRGDWTHASYARNRKMDQRKNAGLEGLQLTHC